MPCASYSVRKWRKSCGINTERSYGNNTEKSCGNNTKRDPPHPLDRRPEYSDDTRDKADGYFQPQTFSKWRTWLRRRRNDSILKASSLHKIIEASLISQLDFYSHSWINRKAYSLWLRGNFGSFSKKHGDNFGTTLGQLRDHIVTI